MTFDSLRTYTSKVDPSVTFVLRKMTRGRRIKFNLEMAALLDKERQLDREAADVDERTEPYRQAAKKLDCSCSHPADQHDPAYGACTAKDCRCRWPEIPASLRIETMDVIRRRGNMMELEYEPSFIRWGLESIQGIEIDGINIPTAEMLIESGPEELVAEIAGEVKKLMGLSPEESKNSELPTTSGALVDGQINPSSVPPVDAAATT